jgi:hypothetical protein
MKVLSRREMLEIAILGLCLPKLGCVDDTQSTHTPTSSRLVPKMNQAQLQMAKELPSSRQKLKQARKCGELWLSAQAEQPKLETLLIGLLPDTYTDNQRLTQWVKNRHLTDINADQYEQISGWTLSRTETHLYAVLALTEPE